MAGVSIEVTSDFELGRRGEQWHCEPGEEVGRRSLSGGRGRGGLLYTECETYNKGSASAEGWGNEYSPGSLDSVGTGLGGLV